MDIVKTENKGIITLNDKVMVSDPCYGLNTWCQGVLENVLPGQYDCNVEYSDEGDWGTRVSAIEVTHVDYDRCTLDEELEKFEVGVDSGQAGIFDYEYYAKYHMDAKLEIETANAYKAMKRAALASKKDEIAPSILGDDNDE